MSEDSSAHENSGINEGGNSPSDPHASKSPSPEIEGSANQMSDSETSSESDIDPLSERRKKAPPVDPTKLDFDAVRDMASSKKAEQDAKLKEELEARPVAPFKSIKAIKYRNASPCSSVCKLAEMPEKITSCDRCRIRVYDFSGMEQPEAEELVFKMEGISNVPFFRRRDGKFLTQDCPVSLQNRQIRAIVATVSGLLFIAVVSLSCMMPKPVPPPAPSPVVKEQGLNAVTLSKVDPTQIASRGWLARVATQGVSKAPSKPPISPMSSQYASYGGLDPETAFRSPAPGEAGFVQPAVEVPAVEQR